MAHYEDRRIRWAHPAASLRVERPGVPFDEALAELIDEAASYLRHSVALYSTGLWTCDCGQVYGAADDERVDDGGTCQRCLDAMRTALAKALAAAPTVAGNARATEPR